MPKPNLSFFRRVTLPLLVLFGAPISAALALDARVLPKGVSRFSFTYAQSNGVRQQYNDQGVVQDITAPYNMNLDSSVIEVAAAKMSPEFGNLIQLLNDTGLRYDASKSGTPSGGITSTDPTMPLLGDALTKGFLGIEVEARQSQSVLQYMHGVTDRLSVGFMVPIVKTSVRASANITKVNNTIEDYQRAFESMGPGFEPIVQGFEQLGQADIETLQQFALESNGYRRFGSSEQNGVGDLNFGGRYNYLKTRKEHFINSGQFSVSAPTGRTRQANTLTEVDNGTGTWDFTAAHVLNYQPTGKESRWMLSHAVHTVYRMPGKRIMRVRENPDDFLPNASSEEEVRTRYAPKFWTTLGARFRVNDGLSFETNYEWYWKGLDRFSGSRDKDYSYLSSETKRYLETLNIGATLSLMKAYERHQIPIPMEFSANYFTTLTGRNAAVADIYMLEMAMYF